VSETAGTGSASSASLPSVKERTLRGTIWTVGHQATSQLLRFGSNVVLTRFLMPEAFGLMSLVWVFIMGLEMLSDVGAGPAIIRSQRGDDPVLLDTAWTVQIIRGFILLALSALVAPVAVHIYRDTRLLPLIVVAGVGIAIRGFTPTRVHSLNRQVVLGRLTAVELASQMTTIVLMVAGAWWYRSVWSLLIGTLAGDVVRVVLCYRVLPGRSHRLRIDRQSVGEIVHVGRWIVVSTAMTYAAGHLDRMVIGRLLSIHDLGVYAIANQIVLAGVGVGRAVSARVFFPVLAETLRQSPELLYKRLRRARLMWIAPTTAGLLGLYVGGGWFIRLIYKPDYHAAGWMLQILAAGAVAGVLNNAAGMVWMTLGKFKTMAAITAIQILLSFPCMFVGYHLYGTTGFVVGVACVELLLYPLQSALVARRKLWQPEVDLPVLAVLAVAVALGVAAR